MKIVRKSLCIIQILTYLFIIPSTFIALNWPSIFGTVATPDVGPPRYYTTQLHIPELLVLYIINTLFIKRAVQNYCSSMILVLPCPPFKGVDSH